MKYYIVQVQEEQEMFVKEKIESDYPSVKVIMPIESDMIELQGRKVIVFNRQLEDYIIISAEDTFNIKKLNDANGVIKVLRETCSLKSPIHESPKEELVKFLSDTPKDIKNIIKKGFINVVKGPNSGRRGKIKTIKEGIVTLQLFNHSKNESCIIRIPLWCIVKVLD